MESRNSDYQKGKLVMGSMGWTTYSVVDPDLTQVCNSLGLNLNIAFLTTAGSIIKQQFMRYCSYFWGKQHFNVYVQSECGFLVQDGMAA